jgi:hypothetical protein
MVLSGAKGERRKAKGGEWCVMGEIFPVSLWINLDQFCESI